MTWQGENFGYAVSALAAAIEPDRPALIHGDRVIAWPEFDSLTDSIAAGLLAQGLKPGDVAGQMLRNTPEYLLAYFGCAKAGVTPVNVNYHYQERELADIFTRFGLKALFAHGEYVEMAGRCMPEGALQPFVAEPGNERWDALCSTGPTDDFSVCQDASRMFYLATGGTTGMPKAVMWPFSEAWKALGIGSWSLVFGMPPKVMESLDEHVAMAVATGPDSEDSSAPLLPLCPLMHGTAQYSAVGHLLKGGTVVTLPMTSFDADLAIDTIRDRRVRSLVIVGDAHALPLLDALEARDDAKEAFASLRAVGSSGALFATAQKERLLAVNSNLIISDVLGSSESGGTAIRITTQHGTLGNGNFVAPPDREVTLFDEDFNPILPGSDAVGIVARPGALPLGYLGEDEKNAQTFPVIGGRRYLMTGDRARWKPDGTLEFIGRDNMCINSGGEKIFPEEVEEVLQAHPAVKDARVVSLPDPRFGRKVVAVVNPQGNSEALADTLDAAAREGLAAYKVPRAYFFTDRSLRLNNGKPDYKTAQAIADEMA